jgi:phytoene dehydrogenase-like protein
MANQYHTEKRQKEFDALLKRFPPLRYPTDTGLWVQVIVTLTDGFEIPVLRWIPSREDWIDECKEITEGRNKARELGFEWRDHWHGPMDINQLVPKEPVPCPQDAAEKST